MSSRRTLEDKKNMSSRKIIFYEKEQSDITVLPPVSQLLASTRTAKQKGHLVQYKSDRKTSLDGTCPNGVKRQVCTESTSSLHSPSHSEETEYSEGNHLLIQDSNLKYRPNYQYYQESQKKNNSPPPQYSKTSSSNYLSKSQKSLASSGNLSPLPKIETFGQFIFNNKLISNSRIKSFPSKNSLNSSRKNYNFSSRPENSLELYNASATDSVIPTLQKISHIMQNRSTQSSNSFSCPPRLSTDQQQHVVKSCSQTQGNPSLHYPAKKAITPPDAPLLPPLIQTTHSAPGSIFPTVIGREASRTQQSNLSVKRQSMASNLQNSTAGQSGISLHSNRPQQLPQNHASHSGILYPQRQQHLSHLNQDREKIKSQLHQSGSQIQLTSMQQPHINSQQNSLHVTQDLSSQQQIQPPNYHLHSNQTQIRHQNEFFLPNQGQQSTPVTSTRLSSGSSVLHPSSARIRSGHGGHTQILSPGVTSMPSNYYSNIPKTAKTTRTMDSSTYLSGSINSVIQKLNHCIEKSYLRLGSIAESLKDSERAIALYEHVLRKSPCSSEILFRLGNVYLLKESFDQAIQKFNQSLEYDPKNPAEIHGSLGHCYLMKEDNQNAYHAYQLALGTSPPPSDPRLWYGIGVLYDRLFAHQQAEISFNTSLVTAGLAKMNSVVQRNTPDFVIGSSSNENGNSPNFLIEQQQRKNKLGSSNFFENKKGDTNNIDHRQIQSPPLVKLPDLVSSAKNYGGDCGPLNSLASAAAAVAAGNCTSSPEQFFEYAPEVYFRLGMIYKQQGRYENSLACFRKVLYCPPNPLTTQDVQYQIGYCYELNHDFAAARKVYEYILTINGTHSRTLQQYGWLLHTGSSMPSRNSEDEKRAEQLLLRATQSDTKDAFSFYLLGRFHMAHKRYANAHSAFQQAVYREPRNPMFWCSIGVLYFGIRQYRDALDAYTRAIEINPDVPAIWFDLGALYETCQNQLHDALDAYERALFLDTEYPDVRERISFIKSKIAKERSLKNATQEEQHLEFSSCPNEAIALGGPDVGNFAKKTEKDTSIGPYSQQGADDIERVSPSKEIYQGGDEQRLTLNDQQNPSGSVKQGSQDYIPQKASFSNESVNFINGYPKNGSSGHHFSKTGTNLNFAAPRQESVSSVAHNQVTKISQYRINRHSKRQHSVDDQLSDNLVENLTIDAQSQWDNEKKLKEQTEVEANMQQHKRCFKRNKSNQVSTEKISGTYSRLIPLHYNDGLREQPEEWVHERGISPINVMKKDLTPNSTINDNEDQKSCEIITVEDVSSGLKNWKGQKRDDHAIQSNKSRDESMEICYLSADSANCEDLTKITSNETDSSAVEIIDNNKE